MTRSNYFLSRRLDLADLAGSLAIGVFIGYERQKIADSGELILEKIFVSIFFATGAYLIAFLITRLQNFELARIPRWVSLAFIGAILCSLSLHVLSDLIKNRHYRPDLTVFDYVWQSLPDRVESFLVMALLYSVVSLLLLGLMRVFLRPRIAQTGS